MNKKSYNKGKTNPNYGKKFPKEEFPNYGTRGMKFTDEHKRKISEGNKGKKRSKEAKKAISIRMKAARADPNSTFNSSEYIKKQKESYDNLEWKKEASRRMKVAHADLNSSYNSLEYKEKQKIAHNTPKFKIAYGKKIKALRADLNSTYNSPKYIEAHKKRQKIVNSCPEKIAKRKKTLALPEVKEKFRESLKEYWRNPEARERQSKNLKKVREKLISAWEKRAESSGYPRNYLCPNFNLLTIPIFKSIDKILHTRGRYGGTKAGEKKLCGKFADYYNKKYEFLVEWNEPGDGHYNPDGSLSQKDIDKRDKILAKYPNLTYIIIKQSDWFNNEDLTKKIEAKIMTHILEEAKIF